MLLTLCIDKQYYALSSTRRAGSGSCIDFAAIKAGQIRGIFKIYFIYIMIYLYTLLEYIDDFSVLKVYVIS